MRHVCKCKCNEGDITKLNVCAVLEPHHIIPLHLVNKHFYKLTRDNELWRNISFNTSSFDARRSDGLRSRRPTSAAQRAPRARDLLQQLTTIAQVTHTQIEGQRESRHGQIRLNDNRSETISTRSQGLAEWDLSYPTERVDWYGEYIARHAPLSVSWLQQPSKAIGGGQETCEVKGMGYHTGYNGSWVVAPLEDGSVCLWDLNHGLSSDDPSKTRRGAIIAQSRPGLLWENGADGSTRKYSEHFTGTVECVSVDNIRNKAYIATQSQLNEVDLETLQISSCQRYHYPITALSTIDYPVPLTVGTTKHLYLHDPRQAKSAISSFLSQEDQVEIVATYPARPRSRCNDFSRLLASDPPSGSYAPLFQPRPLSIVHLASNGSKDPSDGEIYVGGRFPSILVYDRRFFPKLQNTIHSGARLCSLAALPYPTVPFEKDMIEPNQLPCTPPLNLKSQSGSKLIACGEYNGKGSLEIYNVSPSSTSSTSTPRSVQPSHFHNRVNAAKSKLLSVATHGTRLVTSDGNGELSWWERDGHTLVRRWNFHEYQEYQVRSDISGVFGMLYTKGNTGDAARKILPTNEHVNSGLVARDELLLWTGEKIGLVRFRSAVEEWEQRAESIEERMRTREERAYRETMRKALKQQADEVRFMTGLGLGR